MKVKFWVHTNGGFKKEQIIELGPNDRTDEEIKAEVEDWASQFHQWHTSRYRLVYGFDRL